MNNNFKKIFEENSNNIAFIIGNGINRFNADKKNNDEFSWKNILKKLWVEFFIEEITIPNGIMLTEFFDVLKLRLNENGKEVIKGLKKKLINITNKIESKCHHIIIIEKLQKINKPLLTTNFDNALLVNGLTYRILKSNQFKFNDFYPWSSYYSNKELNDPCSQFGLWFINGISKYPRSIRIGLTDYMGSVQKARRLVQNLNKLDKRENWEGYNTWLNIFFHKPLFIFGLRLEENETFLRWLLIEKAKYQNTHSLNTKNGWYIESDSEKSFPENKGKHFFLKNVGIEIIESNNNDIYEFLINL